MEPHHNGQPVPIPLKFFGLDISASNGCGLVPEAETFEAFGAFLMANAGYPSAGVMLTGNYDQTFEWRYKGRVWRVTFCLVCDVGLGKLMPFRIDFDYIKQAA